MRTEGRGEERESRVKVKKKESKVKKEDGMIDRQRRGGKERYTGTKGGN